MGSKLKIFYDREADILHIDRMHPYAQQESEELDAGNVAKVIKAIVRLVPKTDEQRETVKTEVGYFQKHRKTMRYDVFRHLGIFVGSGVLEAGCRAIIGQRLKQSGMHWTLAGANSVIALRCLLFNSRWEDFWAWRARAT